MSGCELHNKRCDDFAEDVQALLTITINELYQQQNVCDVKPDIERFEMDLRMLEQIVDSHRVH